MSEFKVGMKVRIKGDAEDYTDHLDGKIGTIIDVNNEREDCLVEVEGSDRVWFIWFRNMTPVEPTSTEPVFSIYQWYKSCNWVTDGLTIDEAVRRYEWVIDCEGKTEVECKPYLMASDWLVPANTFVPYIAKPTVGKREYTIVYNVQITSIVSVDEEHELTEPEERNRNVERFFKKHIDFVDDIKVIDSQVFERELE